MPSLLEERVAALEALHARQPLSATSDRPDGFYTPPSGRSAFDNADGSPVVLQIPEPGKWLVGWRGYVLANGGSASMEADVFISPAGADDPFAASDLYPTDADFFPAFSVVEGSDNRSVWLQAMTFIEIAAPSQIVGAVYPNTGAMRISQLAYLKLPALFAWPVG